MMPTSAAHLLSGQVMHHRLRPVVNRFAYPVFACLLPLSRIESVGNKLFSINRFNLLSFHFSDHGARDGSHPTQWVRSLLAQHGLSAEGEIWLQCFPRLFGFVFNPVSFWFCHDKPGALRAILVEVNNTFGERHNYLLAHPDGRPIEEGEIFEREKVFHVSPFMAVAGSYRFRFATRATDDGTPLWRQARIDHADAGGDLLKTAIAGRTRPLTAGAALQAVVAYPLMTFGVVFRIHWQALRLWLRHVPFFTKPEPPIEETTT